MSKTPTLTLPEDLAAFAQTQVDSGQYGSLVEVVRDAFVLLQDRSSKVAALQKELDVGIDQLDAGQSTRSTPREMMDEMRADIGVPRNP